MKVRVRLVSERATMPVVRPDGVGIDMHATYATRIQPDQIERMPLGVAWEIPAGYVGLVVPRSGLTSKLELSMLGVIDDTYRGEVCANLWNPKRQGDWVIMAGDRVCQMLIVPAPMIELEAVAELSESCRGDRGFGSTGR